MERTLVTRYFGCTDGVSFRGRDMVLVENDELCEIEMELHNAQIRIKERDKKIKRQAEIITKLEKSRIGMKASLNALKKKDYPDEWPEDADDGQ